MLSIDCVMVIEMPEDKHNERENIFGARLKAALQWKGLAAHAVAVEAGINPPNFYNILAGRKKPSDKKDGDIDKLAKVAELGVSKDELLAWLDFDRLGTEGAKRLKRYLPDIFGIPALGVLVEASRGAHPPTQAEIDFLSEAQQVGVWDPVLNEPEFWRRPAEERWKNLALMAMDVATHKKIESVRVDVEERRPKMAAAADAAEAELRSAEAIGDAADDRVSRISIPEGMDFPPTPREIKLLKRMAGWEGTELDPQSGSPLWQVPPGERWAELRQAEKDWLKANGLDDADEAARKA